MTDAEVQKARQAVAATGDAEEVLVKWMAGLLAKDWRKMAELSVSTLADLDELARLLASNFKHREIESFTHPGYVGGEFDEDPEVPVGVANFAVRATLSGGRGVESFIARVVYVDSKWKVNPSSTLDRSRAPNERTGDACSEA